jgi:hypothetical protein
MLTAINATQTASTATKPLKTRSIIFQSINARSGRCGRPELSRGYFRAPSVAKFVVEADPYDVVGYPAADASPTRSYVRTRKPSGGANSIAVLSGSECGGDGTEIDMKVFNFPAQIVGNGAFASDAQSPPYLRDLVAPGCQGALANAIFIRTRAGWAAENKMIARRKC